MNELATFAGACVVILFFGGCCLAAFWKDHRANKPD